MKAWFAVSMLLAATTYFGDTSCIAQSQSQVDKINSFWNNLDKRYPNLNKTQTPGTIQKPGEIQKPGDIQVPRGIKAITQKSSGCNQRFLVGADTLFEFDKATLTPYAQETLEALKPMIMKLGPHPVAVEGHTDAKGSDEYNQNLSERRAERVKNWLLESHICSLAAVSTSGYGKKRPVAPNTNPDGTDNPKGRALNRRVEIVVDTCKPVEEISSTPAAGVPSAGTAASTTSDAAASPSSMKISDSAVVDNSVWLPYSNVVSAEEMKNSFTRLKVTPLKNKSLYFEISVPNGWDSKPLEVPPDVVKDDEHNQVPLAQIEPNNDSKAIVEVRYMRVPEDVPLSRFVQKYADLTGFQLVTRQHAEFNQHEVEDALLKKGLDSSTNELTRLTAARKGPLVMFVASSCPEKDYDKWKNIFAAAAMTFDPYAMH